MPRSITNIEKERFYQFIEQTYWFHTIDLGNDLITDGVYDLKPILSLHKFDESLAGKSVLDVGSSDGFYSFEFERRGAQSVLAIDTNAYDGSIPTDVSPSKREKFAVKYSREREEYEKFSDIFSAVGLKGSNKLVVLADYLDSIVQFKQHSIYDLEQLGRTFDLVFCGGLFGHLKNPLKGIEQLRLVTSGKCIITVNGALPQPGGTLSTIRRRSARVMLRALGVSDLFSENDHDLILKYIGNKAGGSFFHIHPVTFREMLLASGFKEVEIVGDYTVVDRRINFPQRGAVFHCSV